MLKLKFQYFSHLMRRVDSWEKTDVGRAWRQEQNGMTEDEMPGWHHQLDGYEFEWTLGVGDGQGGLVCCNSWGRKELDTTEQLNWANKIQLLQKYNTACLKAVRIFVFFPSFFFFNPSWFNKLLFYMYPWCIKYNIRILFILLKSFFFFSCQFSWV